MRRIFSLGLCTVVVTLLTGCGPSDREQAHRRAEQAREKARAEGQRLREDARRLDRNIHQAVTGTGPSQSADEKLRRGADDLRAAGSQAAVKLDHAAIIAKVKTALATSLGLSSVADVSVEASGSVVTLQGTVASDDQKRRAGDAARNASGVTNVINNLKVRP